MNAIGAVVLAGVLVVACVWVTFSLSPAICGSVARCGGRK